MTHLPPQNKPIKSPPRLRLKQFLEHLLLCLQIDRKVFKKRPLLKLVSVIIKNQFFRLFAHILLGRHLKKLNTETTKNLIRKTFFINLLKNYTKGRGWRRGGGCVMQKIKMINFQLLRMCLGKH